MGHVQSAYKIFRALSLDVVFGAIILSKFVAKLCHANVPTLVFAELGLAVWIIYTWDHLSDAKKMNAPSTFRHKFHKQHEQSLKIGLLIALLSGALLIWQLPVNTVYYGAMAAGFVLAYFVLIQLWSRFHYKELMSGVLYAVGVFIGPVSMVEMPVAPEILILFLEIMLIALTNLIIFANLEQDIDRADGQLSFARLLGNRSYLVVNILCLLLFAMIITVMLTFFDHEIWLSQAVIFAMILMLASINWFEKFFSRNERYRLVGDAIFFLPIFVLI